jgi:hypothetical protein
MSIRRIFAARIRNRRQLILYRIRGQIRRHLPLRLLVLTMRKNLTRLREIPRWIRETVVIMCAARVVCYTAALLYWLSPRLSLKKVDPFLLPSYHNPMVLVWYIKYLCNDIELLLISYAFCKISARVSNYLFLVSVIFFIYHVTDCLMFVWNFKRYDLLYFDLMWTTLAFVVSVFRGYRPETIARIKSLF